VESSSKEQMERNGMLKLGEWISRYRWIWLALVAAISLVLVLQIGDIALEDDETTWFPSGDANLTTFHDFEDRYESSDVVVVAYAWADPFSIDALTALDRLTRRLEAEVPYVRDAVSVTAVDDIVGTSTALAVRPLIGDIRTPDVERVRDRIRAHPFIWGNLISKDERVVSVVLELQAPSDLEAEEASAAVLASIRAVLEDEASVTGHTYHTGGARITDEQTEAMLESDLRRFFPLTLLLTFALLLVFYRSAPSVVLPLITVTLSLGWTLGLKALVGSPISPVSTTLFALITVIGVADSVHLISQYWHEKEAGGSRATVLLETYRRAGLPCLLTSATTAVGFGSLVVSPIPAIRHLGGFAAFGIMAAFALSMILVPIGMDWFAHRRPRAPRNRWLDRGLARVAGFNRSRPTWVLVVAAGIAVGMAFGIGWIRPEGSMVGYFKPGSSFRESVDFFDSHLNGVSGTEVLVYGDRDAFRDPEALASLSGLAALAEQHENVAAAYSMVDTVRMIWRALHDDDPAYATIPDARTAISQSMLLYEMSGGAELRDYVSGDYAVARVSIRTRQMEQRAKDRLMESITTYADRELSGFRVEITGMDHLVNVTTTRIVQTQIASFGIALLVITAIMVLVFGWRAGLISLLPNVLPIVFVFGLMGYAGYRLNMATAIIASIAIGIVVDDTIHFFTHFREEFRRSGHRQDAMQAALAGVGKALCLTTIILVAGFGVFLFSESGILSSYGVLSGVAVLIALLGDLFVGPVLLSRLPAFERRPPGAPST
jgi:hypothetical protein